MSEKRRWWVTLPVTGTITFEVEAESEETAIDAALEEDPDKGDLSWNVLEKVCSGNVFHGELNEAYAEKAR